MRCSQLALTALAPLLANATWAPAPGGAAAVDPPAARAADGTTDETPGVATFPELGLTLELGRFGELERRNISNDSIAAMWRGELGECQVELTLSLLPGESFPVTEPIEIRSVMASNMRRRARKGDEPFRFTKTWLHEGAYGFASYAAAGSGPYWEKGEEAGAYWCLAGMLADKSYALHALFEPAPSEELAAEVARLFEEGIAYEGSVRDANWTDEEAEARWRRDVPDDLADELDLVMRTDHYLIMSNKGKAKLFGKKMEAFYKEIQETFPFEDCEGQKLMPVFVFITPDQYFDYYVKIAGVTLEAARQSGGHAWRDYYAAPYGNPNAPVHIHEATHQIFGNRLFLNGGGSWFQEGVAEYVESSENERNVVANAVKKGRHVRLREFVGLPSLLYSSEKDRKTGGSAAGDAYKQAALFIEFLRDSKWAKKEKKGVFPVFLQIMGDVQRNDVEAIEAVFKRLYGLDLDELDAKFMEYCKKR